MQTTIDTKIKEGQVWRNKEKGYTITVLTQLKKGVWQVSAHGKGRTSHKMTENSFHFYDLISKDDLEPTTKKEKMNINNKIRLIFNNSISVNHIFSVDDVVNSLLEEDEIKDFKKEKLKTSVSAFISGCLKTKNIKKLSDKMKVATSKKVYQKLNNSNIISKRKHLATNANINGGLFKKVFNEQLGINQKFTTTEFMQKTINTVDCGKLNKKETDIIKARITSFISNYTKRGYIKKISDTFELIKLKYIDDNRIQSQSENIQETKIKPVVVVEDHSEDHSENKLNVLLKKFESSPVGELVESFVLYFNILQEKEKSYKLKISKLEDELKDTQSIEDKENINALKEKLNMRETKIMSLNKEVCSLKDKVKQLDNDVNHQLDENQKLQTINDDLNSKILETEPTDAWKKISIGEVLPVRPS